MLNIHPNSNRADLTRTIRRPVVLGLFVGVTVGVGYLLAAVPNVELMTLLSALAGAALGPRLGFVSGFLAMAIYSLGSPYGLPHPLLLASQVVGMGSGGIVGHFARKPVSSLVQSGNQRSVIMLSMLIGFFLTLVYDLATNMASWVAYDLDLWVILVGGLPLFLIHAGVNLVLFGFFFPLLVTRVMLLKHQPLSGHNGNILILLFLGLCSSPAQAQTTVSDSTFSADSLGVIAAVDSTLSDVPTIMAAPLTGAALAHGWQRPVWQPFAESALQWLNWNSSHVVLRDGGVGAMTMILGEGGTTPYPVFLRDGIPMGTGHFLADDPGLIPLRGLRFGKPKDNRHGIQFGHDGWGGTGGSIALWTDDFAPGKAVSIYSGVKGPHESYMRSFVMRSPLAAWRFTFDFEEKIDNGGYNYTTADDRDFSPSEEDMRGHGKIRMARGRLTRYLDGENQLSLEYSTARKTKDEIPVLGAEAQELWSDELALAMQSRLGPFGFHGTAFWINRDVQWGSRSIGIKPAADLRKIETSREGLVLALNRPENWGFVHNGGLKFTVNHWRLDDTGPTKTWSEDWTGTMDGDGVAGELTTSGYLDLGGPVLNLNGGGYYDQYGGWLPGGLLTFAGKPTGSWWEMSLARDGRAPRSDELFTPQQRFFGSRIVTIYPNSLLVRENTKRASIRLAGRVFGLDLALDASARQLTDGITWQYDGNGTNSGSWNQGLHMNSTRITGQVAREGRFLGWGGVRLEGTWQKFDEKEGQAAFLPPEKSARMELKWENHFFKEDGILQVALMTWWKGQMADPWDVSRQSILPETTRMDLILGFRLVGANISIALRNLADQKVQMTTNSWSTEKEFQWRINWTFLY